MMPAWLVSIIPTEMILLLEKAMDMGRRSSRSHKWQVHAVSLGPVEDPSVASNMRSLINSVQETRGETLKDLRRIAGGYCRPGLCDLLSALMRDYFNGGKITASSPRGRGRWSTSW